jgi:Fungalysin metallopeptidase (M36)/PA domain/Secretion system C-terminal sorting domain/Fungalysin/Thermolysin Propeptide Motif
MRKSYLCRNALLAFLMLWAGIPLSAQKQNDAELKSILQKNAAKLSLSNQDIADAVISSAVKDEKTGLQYVYLQQAYRNIKVYNQVITVLLKNNTVSYSSGAFIKELSKKGGTKTQGVPASQAIVKAAEHLKTKTPDVRLIKDKMATDKKMIFSPGGIARENIETELIWYINEKNEIKLCWNVNISMTESADWWNVQIDAVSGEYVNKDNWTVHEANPKDKKNLSAIHVFGNKTNAKTFSPPAFSPASLVTNGNYYVCPFPIESPLYGNFATESNPWLKAGAGNNATTHGWHFDGTTDYITTQGNNVHAYEDRNNANVPGMYATSSTPIPGLNFATVPDFTLPATTAANQSAAITNLFYWNNIIHDVLYQYGFTEAAGNFQQDNLGRGGLGGDYVRAEAQDGLGINNANFGTPVDGLRPRMQMYLFYNSINTFTVNTPAAIAGNYTVAESGFSVNNKLSNVGPVSGQVVSYDDGVAGNLGCLPAINAAALNGKIALITRGTCGFIVKVKNAQNAGAIGVIMINNAAGAPIVMGGTDNTITIPAVMVSQADGALLNAQVANNLNITMTGKIIEVDGDFDNGVITHEYGHGVSNRLTGGPNIVSCLSHAEQGGEGWSDYLALMLTQNWATTQLTDGSKRRTIANYDLSQSTTGSGFRNFPYSTNMAISPLTYANMGVAPIGTQVHNIGEIWCSALWEMTWEIIKQTGTITSDLYQSTEEGGNIVALRLVMEGMKLQPCRPGYIDARNAILAADQALYNGKYSCSIWKAFAKRGMGFSASQGSNLSAIDQTAAFNYPCVEITCPSDITVNADAGLCSASLNLTGTNGASAVGNPAPVITYAVNGNNIVLPYAFPVGTTEVTATATNNLASASCTFKVTVVDNQAPVISNVSANPATLAPPNHKMRDVTVTYTVTDNCGAPVTSTLTVSSNEPIDGTGDGDTSPDWEITDATHVKLRAERAGTGSGRIYTITITSTDAAGNTSSKTVPVLVAHNISAPISGLAVKVGSTVNFTGTFWDVAGSKHTAKWLIDGSTSVNGTVTEPSGLSNGKVTGSYKFTAAGVYKLQMNVTDQKGITTFANTNGDLDAIVVVYDPSGGYTVGGGWFSSPAGAYSANASASGKVSFGFQSNYFKGAANPKGETQLEFKVGNLEFNALNYEYLAVSGAKAQFKGSGKIIGDQSGYSFIMTAIDGAIAGGKDRIRMKIFNKNTGKVIYDNQPGASDAADPITEVGTGSTIVITGGAATVEARRNTDRVIAEAKLSVIASPNPSSSYFTLVTSSGNAKPINIKVVDILGRTVENINSAAANATYKIGRSFTTGVYYAEVTQGDEKVIVKLVKTTE